MAIAVLDPKLYLVTYAGITLGGFADGTPITYDPASNVATSRRGMQGTVAVAKNLDPVVIITLTFLQTSLSNKVLSDIVQLARVTPGSIGQAELLIQDVGSNGTVLQGPAWVAKLPTVGLGQEVGDRAWTLECEALTNTIGGTVNAA